MAITVQTSDETMVEMNNTPLIDVMLVLLTLLILTLPMQTNAVKLEMPLPDSRHVKPETVVLQIDFDGTAIWNGKPVNRAEMDALMIKAAQQPVQPEIHIAADRIALYGPVATVMADAQRLGLERIGFADISQYDHLDRRSPVL